MSQCSRFIEGNGFDACQLLECATVFDDDAVAGCSAHSRDEGNRRSNDQWARGCHNQHLSEVRRVATDQPGSDGQDIRHNRERNSVTVCHSDKGSFTLRCLFHQLHNALILAVFSSSSHLHPEHGRTVNRTTDDRISLRPLNRDALTRE